jgi:hypothetical protein
MVAMSDELSVQGRDLVDNVRAPHENVIIRLPWKRFQYLELS